MRDRALRCDASTDDRACAAERDEY
jgi:hypothetical protein